MPQQVGNTCGHHTVVNAYLLICRNNKQTVDMSKIDVKGTWIEQEMKMNGAPPNIFLLGCRNSILDEKKRHIGLVEALVALKNHRKVVLIVNTIKTRDKSLSH